MKITTRRMIARMAICIGLPVAIATLMFVGIALPKLLSDKDCGNAFGRVGEDTHSHQVDDGSGSTLDITHCHVDGDSAHPYSEND